MQVRMSGVRHSLVVLLRDYHRLVVSTEVIIETYRLWGLHDHAATKQGLGHLDSHDL